MTVENTSIAHYNDHKFGMQRNMDPHLRVIDGLDPDDASMLIRAALGVAVRAAEEAFVKCIESRVIDTHVEHEDGTLRRVYKDLNRKG